jgi:hypothetical protein
VLEWFNILNPDRRPSILFAPGVYHVRRQREYTPEGFRRVED